MDEAKPPSEEIIAVQVGTTEDGEPMIVPTEARVIRLEERVRELEAAMRRAHERELMLIAELTREIPEAGELMKELRERVMSYPIDGG